MTWFDPLTGQPWAPSDRRYTQQTYPTYNEWGQQVGVETMPNPNYPQPPSGWGWAGATDSQFMPPPVQPTPEQQDWQQWLDETAAGDGEGNFTPATPGDQPIVNGELWPGYEDEGLPANPYQTPPFFDNSNPPWNQNVNRPTYHR